MTDRSNPGTRKDVEDAVRWALAEGKTLEVVGRGSKRGIGRPSQTDLTLDLSGLSGVTLYEPEELVLSAKAGTPIAEIEALVDEQQPAARLRADGLRPAARRAGRAGHARRRRSPPTSSGPRRIKAGAARDHFLGVTAVSGRGETFKSGGRVVKNVTGYDLCKLLAGSCGTLAAMTEVTIKVLPKPETEATVLVLGLDDAERQRGDGGGDGVVLRRLRRGASARRRGVPVRRAADAGSGDRVAPRRRRARRSRIARTRLPALLRPLRTASTIARRGRFARALARRARRQAVLPRLGAAAAAVARLDRAGARHRGRRRLITPARRCSTTGRGGLIWVALPPSRRRRRRRGARAAVAAIGGHATLIRAPAAVRAAVDVFEPQEPGLARADASASRRASIPRACSIPGRMWAGV